MCRASLLACPAFISIFERQNLSGWYSKPELSIEIPVVIPGQPVCSIQQVVWQGDHLGETGENHIDFVHHALRRDDRNITDDLNWSVVHPGKASPCTLPRQ